MLPSIKYIGWFFILIFCVQACAVHAPMSELVMFEKSIMADSSSYTRSGAVTYLEPAITGKDFEEFRKGDYASYTDGEVPSITLHTLRLYRKKGRSISIGRGTGIDWTNNIRSEYYGSFALSFPHSARGSLHRVIVNKRWIGLSTGVFSGVDSRRYYNTSSEFIGLPNKSVFLLNSGLRTRYLIRDPRSPGIVMTGAFEIGYSWTTKNPFVGFNLSFSSLY